MPDRLSVTAGAPERDAVVLSLPARADRRATARAALPGPFVHPRGRAIRPARSARGHVPMGELDDRQRFLVADARRPGATDRARPRSTTRPSTRCRSPRRSAGRAARRRSAARERWHADARGTARASKRSPNTSGPSPAIRRSERSRGSPTSSSTGPSNWTTSHSPARTTSHARCGARCQRRPRS